MIANEKNDRRQKLETSKVIANELEIHLSEENIKCYWKNKYLEYYPEGRNTIA